MGKYLSDSEIRTYQNKIRELLDHIDDVNETICNPYKWCDNIEVLRKIEQLLRKGSKLVGDKL